jgi:hypothetical protein
MQDYYIIHIFAFRYLTQAFDDVLWFADVSASFAS